MSLSQRLFDLVQVLRRHRRPVGGRVCRSATARALRCGASVRATAWSILPDHEPRWRGASPGFHRNRHRRDAAPYRVDMGGGFQPFRRDVAWCPAEDAAIRPLLDALAFTAGKANWGHRFRLGLLAIDAADFGAMAARQQVAACDLVTL